MATTSRFTRTWAAGGNRHLPPTASIFAGLKPIIQEFGAGETPFVTGDAALSG